jgi:hypothetical protein
VSLCTRTLPYLHIVASWAEPLKEEDCEGGDLNGGKGDEQPRRRVKRLCKNGAKSRGLGTIIEARMQHQIGIENYVLYSE